MGALLCAGCNSIFGINEATRRDDRDAAAGVGGAAGAGGSGTGGLDANLDDGSAASGGSAGVEGGSDGGDRSCVQGVLAQTQTASTAAAADRFKLSCGSGSAPDVAFEWTAPATDYYVFDTRGSSFDTVLAILNGDCAGAELVCNNNAGSSPQSEAIVSLQKDQRVIVVVDGYLGAKGDVTVHANRVVCPDSDLTGQPLPATLSTVGGANQHTGACGGAGVREKTVRWTAPSAGLYQFSASSTVFAPSLYLERGAMCGGELLQCNANVKGGYPAQVTRFLDAGQIVSVTVDSADNEGEFSFNIAKLATTCPGKPAVKAALVNIVLDDSTGAKVLSPSCNWAGNQGLNGLHPFPEHSYPVHLNLANLQLCTYHIDTNAPLRVYLLRGSKCEGAEVQCIDVESSAQDLPFSAKDNGDYVLVIENPDPFGASVTYSLSTDCP